MSGNQPGKREREKAKRERAERKRERRETRRSESEAQDSEPGTVMSTTAQADVLTALAALHEAHESGRVSFEDFETAKAELIARLQL